MKFSVFKSSEGKQGQYVLVKSNQSCIIYNIHHVFHVTELFELTFNMFFFLITTITGKLGMRTSWTLPSIL